ncbi:3-deoxy-D-manno-octulosonic acid transferase [Desulfofustis limnaeus]|uniref:3-deoxy-D-manno-octulosonic acid transferase n=1 Tax=Desulfofustis limnaeus TaxID=2740163 RepID=A0ABN6M3J8_9BACT|nr:glycosyltransferase N-terminal domain-containing protein [Desulfofustis limnaeus]MDX9895723.1 glycosyltransferase N-terminal domain-containing protein [Desulfofustis sp.]BDD87451.1 3-deoxy-D-manno-octulosonic acid transferase [Desulfofustis limnaeus]
MFSLKRLYNLIQVVLAPLLLLLLPFYLLRHPGKRRHLRQRLGGALPDYTRRPSGTIWIHALSVGEVTSALPLARALRSELPGHTLVFSTTTSSGKSLAERMIGPFVDAIIPFPLDILPVVKRFIKLINPRLFILVETDFWPNLLFELSASGVPALLVNGRISARSMRSYQRYGLFFRPLFNQFRLLCMQTKADTEAMQRLGISPDKLRTLGNLKCAAPWSGDEQRDRPIPLPALGKPDRLLIVCGSTHPGEEQIILDCCNRLVSRHRQVHVALAPRQIDRAGELVELAESFGFSAGLYSEHTTADPAVPPITIIDTIGDLAELYRHADIAFIGGSLVPAGGHNPLEAARHSCPILFGPHMEDFSEIRDDLLASRGAFMVSDGAAWEKVVERLVHRPKLRRLVGKRARTYMHQRGDVITAHLATIRDFL